MILLNELVGSLNDQIFKAMPVDLESIKWGEETARLASAGSVLTGLDMDSVPEPASTQTEEFVSDAKLIVVSSGLNSPFDTSLGPILTPICGEPSSHPRRYNATCGI